MNIVITGLVYLYLLYAENPSEVQALLNSSHFTYFYDNKFFIGVYIAFLYFGFLITYEKVLYVVAVGLSALTVYLYVTDLGATELDGLRDELEQLRAQYDALLQTHTTLQDKNEEPSDASDAQGNADAQ